MPSLLLSPSAKELAEKSKTSQRHQMSRKTRRILVYVMCSMTSYGGTMSFVGMSKSVAIQLGSHSLTGVLDEDGLGKDYYM